MVQMCKRNFECVVEVVIDQLNVKWVFQFKANVNLIFYANH